MRYPRILAAIRSAKWAVQPTTLQAITDALGAHLRGQIRHASDIIPALPGPASSIPAAPSEDDNSSIAVIQVSGIIGKHLSSFETACGGVDVDEIESALMAAIADPDVKSVVIQFDSPGGSVTGVPELADKIRAADGVKPVYAFTDSQMCSAAYWLAAGCRNIFCTPSADVGSIGVYMALVDESEWWAKEGYKLELIKAGEFKAMGIGGQPLADAERALLQADVDVIYSMFTGAVTAGRGDLPVAVMQGQSFMGQAAQAAGLVDEVMPDLDSVLAEIADPTPA